MNYIELKHYLKNVEAIDDFLINNGVKKLDIDNSKNNFINYYEEYLNYYDFKIVKKDLVKVDTSYIKAPARTNNQNHSWYELLYRCIHGDSYKSKANISDHRLLKLLTNLTKMSLEDLKNLYQDGKSNLSLYDFNVFYRDGQPPIYIGINDGTHRIIMAKILGIDYVYTDNVQVYEYNKFKHDVFKEMKKAIKVFKDFLNQSEVFKLSADSAHIKVDVNINSYTCIDQFFYDVSPLDFNKNVESYREYIYFLHFYLQVFKEVEDAYKNSFNVYKHLPLRLLEFMLDSSSNFHLQNIYKHKSKFLRHVFLLKAIEYKKTSSS